MHQFFMCKILKCVHSQGVRISTFSNISTFLRQFFWCLSDLCYENGHCKRFIFEIIRYSKAGGHHVRSLVSNLFLTSLPCVHPKFPTILIQVSENQNSKYQTQSTFYEVMNFFEKSYVYGKRCPNFQLFPNLFVASVPALWSNIYFVGDIIALAIYLL